MMACLATCQVWNSPTNGITVKTLYVPLRKGSSIIPIPDFSQVRPIAALNLPNFPANGDLPQASTLSQNFRQKTQNVYQQNVQSLQDVRVKANQQPFKIQLHNHVLQVPNLHVLNQIANYHQQQLSNLAYQQQNSNSHAQSQNNFYQSEQVPNYQQNVVFLRNNSVAQHQSNGFENGNVFPHAGNTGSNSVVHFQNKPNYGHYAHTPDSVITPRQPASNPVYTQIHNSPSPLQSFQPGSNVNQENLPSTNNEPKYSGEPTRYFQQLPVDTSSTQQQYIPQTTESPSYSTPQHMTYSIQSGNNVQSPELSVRNPFQGFHSQGGQHVVQSQSNQQSQQPVNTYAIVHQRVPTNNYATQGNLQPEQTYSGHYTQSSDDNAASPQATYVSNEPQEYAKASPIQDQSSYQIASQNHMKFENPQNSVENSQYLGNQLVPIKIHSHQLNGHPIVSQIQILMSQFRQNQQDSTEPQYFNQEQSSPEGQQNHDTTAQNTVSQAAYPDPSSETYYPDNKQVFVSPPPDYGSQGHHHQQQHLGGQGYGQYSSPTESHTNQIPVQNGQIAIPNRNYGYQDSTQYNTVYSQ